MDWELKASAWDFTDLGTENDHDPRLNALVGSHSLCLNNNGGAFSVDLKLGRLGDLGDETVKVQKGPLNVSSPSGSSKRTRAISGNQNVTCSVDGCMADLSNCREYHRRHRVCERHSKTPVVSVGGREQRFCQQCSRFQSLAEFDEEKRSCRKRLDGHNRRRRKPQPEAFYLNNGSFLSNHQGARLLQFSGPDAYASSAVPAWPGHSSIRRFPSNSLTNTIHSRADKRFPFLLANEPERSNNHQAVVPEVTQLHSRMAHNSAPAIVHPHSAHSLLSSHRPIQNPDFCSSHLLNPFTHHQQTGTSLQFDGPAHHPRSNITNHDSFNNFHEVRMGSLSPDDLLEKGASQVLPFSWK